MTERIAGPGPRTLSSMLAPHLSCAAIKSKHPLRLRDVWRFPALPGVQTTLCEIEELRMPNYAMLLPSLFCAPAADR